METNHSISIAKLALFPSEAVVREYDGTNARYSLEDEVELGERQHHDAEERRHGAVRHRRQEVRQRVTCAPRPITHARHETLQRQHIITHTLWCKTC